MVRSDKLWKLTWFLNYPTNRFQSLRELNGFMKIQESLVKTMGKTRLPSVSPPQPNTVGCQWQRAPLAMSHVYKGREETQEKGVDHCGAGVGT